MQSQNNIQLSVIICTYKRPDLIKKVLHDISTASVKVTNNWQLIVVDNVGDRKTNEECKDYTNTICNLTYVHEHTKGLSVARNRGVKESTGKWLLFLDDDVRLDKEFIVQLLKVTSRPDIDIICPRIITSMQSDWPRWLKIRLKSGVGQFDLGLSPCKLDTSTKIPVGACMCFRRSIFNAHGPFASKIGRIGGKLFGGEETLLLGNAFKAGAIGTYIPTIIVRHEFVTGKTTKGYWRRQGFYGGRSWVRLREYRQKLVTPKYKLLLFLTISTLKSFSRIGMILLKPQEAFENQYRAIAHLGIAYQTLLSFLEADGN